MFPPNRYPDVLVGLATPDDAAVYRVNDDLALIQTLDFFTPVVDDPHTYGAIAAANALSDVYAMGGEVLLALNICCFPPDLPAEVAAQILIGGAEKVAEAGGVVVGGHTVNDPEPKYGLSVTGAVHPDMIWTKAGARPGDRLLLTKRLGVGIITTAAKGDAADPGHLAQAEESMLRLNRDACRIVQEVGANACTDITGFGFLGHAHEMAVKSGVRLHFALGSLPFLPGAIDYAGQWLFPAGSCHNQRAYQDSVSFAETISEELRMLLFTPETSGGLLVSLPPESADEVQRRCAVAGQPCWCVGDVLDGEGVGVD